ncbi:3-hydroxyacyl-CoA dehydrogenase/enoyl-CoA hydratase family protein [Ignicoccus islandicus]|uniref:3-hydroxyacyl-CoA dehydrogenase/enoyl-CoA hydratase family protein n=1 Tax=Ignicoccus islandicus TaxID=54259 RepID=UPI00094655F2|nr:3-hydroxyacyl-CoA dehydrogenase/enoyl-CoA hydratase family protein [Ignicoccus islandicus]
MEVKRILVVGAGVMGHGIAQVAAMSGFNVRLIDIKEEFLERALSRIRESLEKLQAKGKLKESPEVVLSRIETMVANPEDEESYAKAAKDIDFMIEAVPEILELKQSIFRTIDKYAPKHAILTSNTSSIPITEIAKATQRPEKVAGMHFFNPPVILKLVEVIKGEKTSDETVNVIVELAKKMGKVPIVVKKDVPGFIVNRVMARFLNEGCWAVERGLYTMEQVDAAFRYKLNFPMGAFELADYVGLDVLYHLMKAMKERGMNLTICPKFEQMVKENKLGVKSGEGFYKYPAPGKYKKPSIPASAAEGVDYVYLIDSAINEGVWLVENEVAGVEDVDQATVLGLNLPMGILKLGDFLGLDNVLQSLQEKTSLADDYKPNNLLVRMVKENKLGVKSGEGFYKYELKEEDRGEIKVRREGETLWIVFNRPKQRNALTPQLLLKAKEAMEEACNDEKVKVVILTGEDVFSAGFDLTYMSKVEPKRAPIEVAGPFIQLGESVENCSKPVIAFIRGYALGGGLEVAMMADLRLATEDALLGQPEINVGIIPGGGGTQRLPRYVGLGRAMEMILLGDMIDARTAKEWGLVNWVVPKRVADAEIRLVASKLASKPPIALAAAKEAVRASLEVPLKEGLKLEAEAFARVLSTQDAREGITAFLEKRKPNFKGE